MKQRSKASTVVLASAIAALPLAAPAVQAQRPTLQKPQTEPTVLRAPLPVLKFAERYDKWPASQHIVGMDNGHTIYQNAKGELFYLDPATGDMQFLAAGLYAKFTDQAVRTGSSAPLRMVKWSADKYPGQVAILGVDAEGHVILRNARGEKFYLNPVTGDMVFVK